MITLVAGLALAFVNEITKQPIENAENQAKLDAYNIVFENGNFESDDKINNLISSKDFDCTVDEVLKAVDDNDDTVGYVMSITSPSGYGGDIKIAIGISSKTDTVTGFTVLSNSETAGLGSRCTDDEFKSQFKGKSVLQNIKYVKNSSATGDDEIDAISGATITTSAVTDAVNTAIDVYNTIKEG
jgi:electron transport complex protein RnfG